MQSELACHIGLKGKFFCRVCQVKGLDTTSGTTAVQQSSDDHEHESENEGAGGGTSEPESPMQGQKKKPESLSDMIARVKRFLQVCSASSSLHPKYYQVSLLLDWQAAE